MEAFATLGPKIGIAASCVALSINRAGIYRTCDRLARRHCAMFPRKRRPRPPLALSEAERSMLLLVLNSERFADLGGTVQDAQVSTGLPGALRVDRACATAQPGVLPLRAANTKPILCPRPPEKCLVSDTY